MDAWEAAEKISGWLVQLKELWGLQEYEFEQDGHLVRLILSPDEPELFAEMRDFSVELRRLAVDRLLLGPWEHTGLEKSSTKGA